jgi:tetratricopeptide (TPR) repeat protein
MAALMDASEPRLLGVIDRLEKRIRELEHTNRLPLAAGETIVTEIGGGQPGNGASSPVVVETTAGKGEAGSAAEVRLNQGQSLLSLGQYEAALACFDEILAGEPANIEALIKKGTALEKLQKLNEAIACYDRAIETDQTVTIAYLYKGGVFNRLERYNEALECYEKALRTQEKAHAA